MRRRERRRAPQRAAQQPGRRPRRRPGQHQHGCERRPARVQAERQRHACPPARPVSGSSLARADGGICAGATAPVSVRSAGPGC